MYINIVPNKWNRFKPLIKYIFRIVIVVGPVESVDKKQNPIDVGEAGSSQSGYRGLHPAWNRLLLWRDSGRLIHKLSTGKASFSSNPHIGDIQNGCPYLGAEIYIVQRILGDFSTANAIYPQIIATYPQFQTLKSGYGGFPYLLNIGCVLPKNSDFGK